MKHGMCGVGLVLLSPLVMAEPMSYALINEAGGDVYEIHVAVANSDLWGPNVLGAVLAEEDEAQITLNVSEDVCVYDIKAVFEPLDGEEDAVVFANTDLCEGQEITLISDNGKDYAEVD